jgi:rhodanese-related sulfurtransferase
MAHRVRWLILVLPLVAAAGVLSGCGTAPPTAAVVDPGQTLTGLSSEAQRALAPDGDRLAPVRYIREAQAAGVPIVFVDARTPLDYSSGHIPGAANVPYYDPKANMAELPRDRLVVTYCECPQAEAMQVADALVADGFGWVKVIDEGLGGWRDLGGELTASEGTGE